jgi:hypothetical protein
LAILYQHLAVAADSGNGISAGLNFSRYSFANFKLLRCPVGEWICVDGCTLLGGNGCGVTESQHFDGTAWSGRATQSLAVRARG